MQTEMSELNKMDAIKKLIHRVQKTQHGFLDIQKTADEVFSEHTVKENLQLAKQLLNSETYSTGKSFVRVPAMLYRNSAKDPEKINFS